MAQFAVCPWLNLPYEYQFLVQMSIAITKILKIFFLTGLLVVIIHATDRSGMLVGSVNYARIMSTPPI